MDTRWASILMGMFAPNSTPGAASGLWQVVKLARLVLKNVADVHQNLFLVMQFPELLKRQCPTDDFILARLHAGH